MTRPTTSRPAQNSCVEDVCEMFGSNRPWPYADAPLWQRLLLVPVCVAFHAVMALVALLARGVWR